jgi:hypothetical protein
MPTYKKLNQKHPEWDGPYWRRCRALYAGGKKLLKDQEVLRDIFPPHLNEKLDVYDERCRRAYYIPYAGEVVDMITSATFSEDIAMEAEPAADEWYAEWAKDVSPPGGARQTLQQFLKEQVTTALLCKRAWTLIDLPTMDDVVKQGAPLVNAPAGSLAEQEKLGLLDAYACPIDPEAVWDWECDRDGRLLWILIHYKSAARDGIEGDRDTITERWMYYTPTAWQRYELVYKRTHPPTDPTEVPMVAEGAHSFGAVPVIRMELPDGLWAMGKIESIAVAHMNKRNALSWAQYKSLFPVLTHFAGPPDVTNPITEDPDRMLNQVIGQGHVTQLGDRDRLEYVGPDTAAYATAAQDLKDLRDEMHRVVHQMAMAVDNSAAALQRSGESKQVDQQSTAIILREFGKIVREHAIEIHDMVQAGRQDKAVVWSVEGMDGYSDTTVDTLVSMGQTLELIPIPSATFQREWKIQIARRVLGDSVNEDKLEDIRKELEANITNEQFSQVPPTEKAEREQGNRDADHGLAKADLAIKALASGVDPAEVGLADDPPPPAKGKAQGQKPKR